MVLGVEVATAKSGTYPTLLETVSFSKVTIVSSDVAAAFCISMLNWHLLK